MTCYRFDQFEFDTDTHELLASSARIALRPKTAVLLGVLLEQRRQVISKQTLFTQVWHSTFVQDQSLFQAISEIRKVFAPLQPIRTHPNFGYQWVTPVRVQRVNRTNWRLVTAMLSVLVISMAGLTIWRENTEMADAPEPRNISASLTMLQSPAMQAFSLGLEHLQEQQLTDAWEYFDLAERENPLFLEASMLKAEILFKQLRYIDAQSLANDVLNRAILSGEGYVQVAAEGLLSRISEHNGRMDSALDWARQADSNARDRGFACAADNTRHRISELLTGTEPAVSATRPEQAPLPETQLAVDKPMQISYPDASHCEPLREAAQEAIGKVDLSHCQDITGKKLLAGQWQSLLTEARPTEYAYI